MKPAVVLENIRSAYNVWNIIRTADALWYDVILLWYSPSPFENEKVLKTSLGAEKNVNIKQFYNVKKWLDYLRQTYNLLIGAEIVKGAISLLELSEKINNSSFCIIFWNEVNWISLETLEKLDIISYIPMNWVKESLNVCEAASIFMWELKKFTK